MSGLRTNVMLQLSKQNKVLDTSKSRNDNPVRLVYDELKDLEREPSPDHDFGSQLADDRGISPFSCASELLRCCTPIAGMDDILSCRDTSPLIYQDISSNLVTHNSCNAEKLITLNNGNKNHTQVCVSIQSEPSVQPPILQNTTKSSNEEIKEPPYCNINEDSFSRPSTSESIKNYDRIVDGASSGITLGMKKNNNNLSTFSSSMNEILENIVPIQSSTPKQNSVCQTSDTDNFEKSAEELINQLSRESNNSSSSKNTEKKKRVRNPQKKKQLEKKKYPMLKPCKESCTKKCITKFNNEDRKKIWICFRNLSKQNQRNFVSRNVEKKPKQVSTKSNSRRHNTLIWNLNDTQVCKTFFLSTLGFKNDQTVKTILKANFKLGVKNPKVQEAAPEQRGKNSPWNKLPPDYKNNIKSFIEKLQPTVSHYNIKHAPKRKYLPCGVTFSDIYKDYTTYCKDNDIRLCSWPYFHKIIQEMNLSTSNPRQDLCTTCANHESEHPLKESISHKCSDCPCTSCQKFEQHEVNKKLSREMLDKDVKNKDSNTSIFTADMQKVILMPKLTVKEYFFSRKLVLFNETFVSPGKNQPAYCVVWHEGESGRNAYNVASAYISFMIKFCRDVETIILYTDNCTAQNKNRILFSALLRLINSPSMISTKTIRIVYLEPGHTYMAADTVHANISTKLARNKNIYDKNDFIQKIKESRKKIEVLELTHADMIIFKDDLKRVFPKNYNITSLKIVEFRHGSQSVFLKKSYDEKEFKEFSALKPAVEALFLENREDLLETICRETEPRGISSVKKQDLLKLCPSMPASRRKFFEKLIVNVNAKDLDNDI